MAKEKLLTFFDEDGDRWQLEEPKDMMLMCGEFLDEDLVITYKATRYYHELELAKLELIERGIISKVEASDYDPDSVTLSAQIMAEAIVRRMGKDALRIADSEVDRTWAMNKPDLSKYPKQK